MTPESAGFFPSDARDPDDSFLVDPGVGGRGDQRQGKKGLIATTPDAPGVVLFHNVSPASYCFKPLRKASKCFERALTQTSWR